MPKRQLSDEEFAATWRLYGSPTTMAKATGYTERSVYERRIRVEKNLGIVLPSIDKDYTNRLSVSLPKRGHRHIIKAESTVMPVFSDAHFWPGEDRSTAFVALLEIIREFKPRFVINNGDAFDGARISRHPPVGWINLPDVAQELAACQERLGEIEAASLAANKDASFYWNCGNHDSRYGARLAMSAPEYVRVHGTDIKDHFPAWSFSWASEINDHTIIKHRWHSGVHATHNNAVKSGRSIVTGHCHRLQVTAWGDYNGRRWGVDTGTLSEFGPEHDKFSWGEDNPFNWGQGFAVLTFDARGMLLPPELCEVIDGSAYFRGQVIASKYVKPAKAKRRAA